MKSGKGNTNNRISAAGGNKGKGKRRRVVNTQSNSSQSAGSKNRQSREQDKRIDKNENNSNNGESRTNRSYNAADTEPNIKGKYQGAEDEDGSVSLASTSHTSYNNSSRRGK